MLLTITLTHPHAPDLGYLLHKHPDKLHTFNLSFGVAQVCYPEVTPERCTAALLVEVDPVGLVRDRRGPGSEAGLLTQYVNDRPYVASSFLSVALAAVFGTALAGRCKDRPALVEQALDLAVQLPAVPCRGGAEWLQRLFTPLGYAVTAERLPLDEQFPEWGPSRYWSVTLAGTVRLNVLLAHLYVLLPVLDDDKHYWVGDAEVEKLLRHGGAWLSTHPEREAIAQRYLKRRRRLVELTLSRLNDLGPVEESAEPEVETPQKLTLNQQRLEAVVAELKASGAKRVLDLGCGEGKLLRLLRAEPQFTELVGVDVSNRALEIASERLDLEQKPDDRIKLLLGSLTYRDVRLNGYDAAAIVEVIEHLDPQRLEAFGQVVFQFAQPTTVVLTTPNAEYNVRFDTLPAGAFRHRDHRFEWTRAEFAAWADAIAAQYGYRVRYEPIGPVEADVGSPTQMAVFRRLA
jgi:3' terminal RNA ribose 2'-O-methyltransferase Hen1